MRTATGLAAAIKKEFGLEANVRKGPVGMFDVYLDEAVIYSNRREGGRLPENKEVLQRMRDFLSLPAQPDKKGQAKGGRSGAAPAGDCGCG